MFCRSSGDPKLWHDLLPLHLSQLELQLSLYCYIGDHKNYNDAILRTFNLTTSTTGSKYIIIDNFVALTFKTKR